MALHDELDLLDAEIERLRREHPHGKGVLRLTNKCLRRCSRWKWQQHGWTLSDQQACGIMNGNERERRAALLSVLGTHIDRIEIVSDIERLEVVPGGPISAPK